MDDEILTITASELDEQISEPDGGTLFVLHDPAGIAPSKKISWTRTVSWILKAGSVVAEMIGMGAVTEDKIGAGAVTETKIGAGAVTHDKLGDDAVQSSNVADAAIHVHHLNSEVVNKFGMISLELAAAGVGNASEASPPNYAIDDHYVHTFYLTDQNAVILLENLGDDPVVILSRDVSPSGDGTYRAVVTVRGETGDDIDYKLVVIQFE